MAYVDPAIEIVATGRRLTARALNQRGQVILPAVRAAMMKAGQAVDDFTVTIPEPDGPGSADAAPEEERTRRPTVFSALREVIAAFGYNDPHLGLYGAFGYDLAFQFEPVRQRLERSAGQRDLVLHLPDQIWVLDRKREEATRFSYEFEVDGVSTAGRARETEEEPPLVRNK